MHNTKAGTLSVYLIRHGETAWNAEQRIQGSSDIPLSPSGEAQSHAVAERLRVVPLEAVYASTMQRAVGTARIIASVHGLEVVTMAELRETCLGQWEGMTDAEIVASGQQETLKKYREDPVRYRPPGAETLESVVDRILAAISIIRRQHAEGAIAIVGHGGSLRAVLANAIGVPPVPAMLGFRLENGSVSLVEYGPHRSWIRFANDTCHLQNAKART